MTHLLESKVQKAKAEYRKLKKMAKQALASEYRRGHKVCTTKGLTKSDLIANILNDNYNRKVLDAAFDR